MHDFFPQYSYLLTSQLESQRIYWENKIVHLEKDTAEEVGVWTRGFQFSSAPPVLTHAMPAHEFPLGLNLLVVADIHDIGLNQDSTCDHLAATCEVR